MGHDISSMVRIEWRFQVRSGVQDIPRSNLESACERWDLYWRGHQAYGRSNGRHQAEGRLSIFRNVISDHLTESPTNRLARATHPGMAHFAGTGPGGKTCRECIFWSHGPHDYRSKNGKYRGLIEPAICKKFQQMMRVQGEKIPDEAMACKYFEENPVIPTRFSK